MTQRSIYLFLLFLSIAGMICFGALREYYPASSAPGRAEGRLPKGLNIETRPLSLLLLLADTLRADHLQAYGYRRRSNSSRLASLALGAVVYDRAYSTAPFTMPAMASIFTGLYPDRSGVNNHTPRISLNAQPAGTLAEAAQQAGYSTYAIVTNPWLARDRSGFQRGFSRFITESGDGAQGRRFDARRVSDQAIKVLENVGEKPFLLWVHYLDTHMPYDPPLRHAEAMGNDAGTSVIIEDFVSGRRSKSDIYFGNSYAAAEIEATRRLYDAEIRFIDEQIGRLLDRLDASGRSDDTIVLFAADHGESLGDHDLYFAHDFTLYQELIRVPLMLRIPGVPPARISEAVSLLDLMPSLCSWMHLPCPAQSDGRLLPLENSKPQRPTPSDTRMKAEKHGDHGPQAGSDATAPRTENPADAKTVASATRRVLFAAGPPRRKRYADYPRHYLDGLAGRWTAALSGDKKLIKIPQGQGAQWEYYDLERDAREQRPSPPAQDSAGALPFLQRELEKWEAEMRESRPRPARAQPVPGPAKTPREDFEDSIETQLRELGYLE